MLTHPSFLIRITKIDTLAVSPIPETLQFHQSVANIIVRYVSKPENLNRLGDISDLGNLRNKKKFANLLQPLNCRETVELY